MKTLSEIDQLIKCLTTTSGILEREAFQEICNFIKQSQTPSGAFADRAGNPDWYYSFFGFMICKALGLNEELVKLNRFVLNAPPPSKKNLIEWSVWVLLRQSLKPNLFFKLKISFRLIRLWMFDRQKTDQVYFAFLSMLILNHFWGWTNCISNQIDKLTSAFIMSSDSPTSHLAAALCIRNHAKLNTENLSKMLMKNALPDGGFVAFCDNNTADMLSTAVAVYALNQANTNIGAIRADGLEFVSSLFANGAFLSGDGDLTRDVEYTFYGLLALNSYAKQ